MDAERYREQSHEMWLRAAEGWGTRRDAMRAATAPVTNWMLDALALRPGMTVLELACGPGDTGLAALERVLPGGRLIATDGSEPMIGLVRARAEELGLAEHVEAKIMEAEWIDLGAASVDAVVCRWGYMLLADPGAALRETRRVLRPSGRVALAAWDAVERNPWSSVLGSELVRRGRFERPPPGAPGQYAWADPQVIADHVEDAGFTGVRVEAVGFTFEYQSFDEWWDSALDLGVPVRDAVADMTPEERDDLRDALEAALVPYMVDDGRLRTPASTHVATAEA